MDPIVSVRNLSVIYNPGKPNEFQSLKGVDADIYPEEFTIIFGPSGCGKSTLLYAMSALQKPTSGEVYVNGSRISEASFKEQAIFRQVTVGMIFQSFYLIPSLHILDNVCLPRVFRGESRTERRKIGMQLLERFGIAEQAEKYPNQLSGGQKQRVAIARSLINDPMIILADEPVGNLDSRSAENVMEILQDLKEIDKKAIVLVTHDPSHLEQADRIFSMKDGKIIDEKVQKGKRREKKAEGQTLGEQEDLPRDLQLLLRTFKNMPRQYASNLLNPYKANQWLNYVLRDISDDQFNLAESIVGEYLMGIKNIDIVRESLDKNHREGGAGWDRRRAVSVSERMRRMMDVSQKMKKGSDSSQNALMLLQYLTMRFSLRLDEEHSARMMEIIRLRLENEINCDQLQEILDRSAETGGVGLYTATASHITKEIEMLLLLSY